MNGMNIGPEEVAQLAENIRDVKARYEAAYNAMYEDLESNMGPAGSAKMWHGNRAQQTLTDAQGKKDTFQEVTRVLEQQSDKLNEHESAWKNFDA